MFAISSFAKRGFRHAFVPGLLTLLMVSTIPTGAVSAQENRSESQRREIAQGLEQGANALRALGRNDEAAHLIEIIKQLGNPAENREQPQERRPEPNDREARAQTEREMAESQLDVFRMAHHAFRESEKADAMELVERIIRAREMQLSGRRDEESQEAVRQMPGPEDQIDLLNRASGIWKEFGQDDKAIALDALAGVIGQRANRQANAQRTETRNQSQEPRVTRSRTASEREQPERNVQRESERRQVQTEVRNESVGRTSQTQRETEQRPEQVRNTQNRNARLDEMQQQIRQLSEQLEQLQKQLQEIRGR